MSTPDMTPSDTNPSDTNTQPLSLEGLLATYTAWQGRNVLHEAAHRAENAGEADRAAALRALADRPAEQQVPGALEALSAQHKISSLLAGWRWHTVTAARESGATWSEIAAATGTDAEAARADYVDHIERQARWGYASDRDLARYRAVAAPEHQPTPDVNGAAGGAGGTGGGDDSERFARAEQAVREAEARVERLARAEVFTGVTPVSEPEWDQDGPTSADLEQWAEVLTSWADQGQRQAPAARADYHHHNITAFDETDSDAAPVGDSAGEPGAPARELSELEDTVLWWVGQQSRAEDEAEFRAALDQTVADDHPQREVVIERAVAVARDRFTTHGESLTVEDALGLDTAHILRTALADADHDAASSDTAGSDSAGGREGGDGALGALTAAELLARAERADNLTYVGSLSEVAAAHDELDALRAETARRARTHNGTDTSTETGAAAERGPEAGALAAYVALLADDPGLERVEEFTRLHRQVHHDLDVPAQTGIHRPAGHEVDDPAHAEGHGDAEGRGDAAGRGVGDLAAGIDAQMHAGHRATAPDDDDEEDDEDGDGDGWVWGEDAARWSALLDPETRGELGAGEALISGTTVPDLEALEGYWRRAAVASGAAMEQYDNAAIRGQRATQSWPLSEDQLVELGYFGSGGYGSLRSGDASYWQAVREHEADKKTARDQAAAWERQWLQTLRDNATTTSPLVGRAPAGFAATEQIMDHIAARTADPTAGYDPSAEWGDPTYREPRSDDEAAARTAHVNHHWPATGWVPRQPSPVEDALEAAQERAVLADAAHDPDPAAWADVERLEALADLRPTHSPARPVATSDDDTRWERNGYAATWSAAAAARDGATPPDPGEVRRLVDAARARLAGHHTAGAVADEGRRAQLSVWAHDQQHNDHLAHDEHDYHDAAGYDGSDGDGEGRW